MQNVLAFRCSIPRQSKAAGSGVPSCALRSEHAVGRLATHVIAERGDVRIVGLRRHCRYFHATACPINMAPDDDAETVIDRLPSAEVDAGLIDIVDGNDVTQKEHGLFIKVHDRAGLLQWLRVVRWLIRIIGPGERSITGQRGHLTLVPRRLRVAS